MFTKIALFQRQLFVTSWISEWTIVNDTLQWAIVSMSQLMFTCAEYFAPLKIRV